LCYRQKKFLLAARFLDSAFKLEPQLLTDSSSDHLYLAARSAILAAAGIGDGAGMLTSTECTQWRAKALTWLKAELESWNKLSKNPSAKNRLAAKTPPDSWSEDADLASVREGEFYKTLSEAEQKAWAAFWGQVNTLCPKKEKQTKQP
jgi:hypothetical protein